MYEDHKCDIQILSMRTSEDLVPQTQLMRLLNSENSSSNLKVPRTSATLPAITISDIEPPPLEDIRRDAMESRILS